jgi:hypothetical protein
MNVMDDTSCLVESRVLRQLPQRGSCANAHLAAKAAADATFLTDICEAAGRRRCGMLERSAKRCGQLPLRASQIAPNPVLTTSVFSDEYDAHIRGTDATRAPAGS